MARILTAALWIVASIAYAAPSQLNYQGRLLKTDGTPEAGVVSMDFALCDSSSVLANCWARQTLVVALSDGFYSVMLSATPSDLSTSTHLSIKVSGTELWPRQPLASAPYATVAGNVSGGTVSASSISLSGGSFTVNGVQVVDATGTVTSPSIVSSGGTHWPPVQASASGSYPSATGIYPAGARVDQLRFLRFSNTPIFSASTAAPWESTSVMNPWVIRDGSSYKMYYAGSGTSWQIGLATAPAGVADWYAPANWTRQAAPVITAAGWSAIWVEDPCVLKVDDAADPRPYKMWFAGCGGTSCATQGIGFADSADGMSWIPLPANPILTRTAGADSSSARWPSVIHEMSPVSSSLVYRMWYGCSDGTWFRVCYAESPDGKNWTKMAVNPYDTTSYKQVVVGRFYDNGGWEQTQAPTVVKVGKLYYMTVGRAGATWQSYLLMSRDGIAWTTVGPLLRAEDAEWWFDGGGGIQERAQLMLDGGQGYLFYGAYHAVRARWTIGAAVADF